MLVAGLHHVTALSSDPQKTYDFYTGILGLRLVKKTINFDQPDVYHLYFGNESGAPGTLLTFFPYPGLPKGRKGKGQLITTSFSIPENSLDFWMKRLDQHGIPYEGPKKRFEELVLAFEDSDGLGLELVASNERKGGLFGITLCVECPERTADLLIQMDHTLLKTSDNRLRYASSGPGFVDIVCQPDALLGEAGAGTVHHVAFATTNEQTQLEARKKLVQRGLNVTPVLDRQYFRSIYFREPGGVLFEIATIPPGFTIDEPLEHLGEALKLPPWEEAHRARILERLTNLH